MYNTRTEGLLLFILLKSVVQEVWLWWMKGKKQLYTYPFF